MPLQRIRTHIRADAIQHDRLQDIAIRLRFAIVFSYDYSGAFSNGIGYEIMDTRCVDIGEYTSQNIIFRVWARPRAEIHQLFLDSFDELVCDRLMRCS